MNDKRRRAMGYLLAATMALVMTGGCRSGNAGGETVPPPPRELIEKSMRSGNAPGAPGPPPQASRPR